MPLFGREEDDEQEEIEKAEVNRVAMDSDEDEQLTDEIY